MRKTTTPIESTPDFERMLASVDTAKARAALKRHAIRYAKEHRSFYGPVPAGTTLRLNAMDVVFGTDPALIAGQITPEQWKAVHQELRARDAERGIHPAPLPRMPGGAR